MIIQSGQTASLASSPPITRKRGGSSPNFLLHPIKSFLGAFNERVNCYQLFVIWKRRKPAAAAAGYRLSVSCYQRSKKTQRKVRECFDRVSPGMGVDSGCNPAFFSLQILWLTPSE